MKLNFRRVTLSCAVLAGLVSFPMSIWAHVTFKVNQPLRPGGFGEVTMVVPNERGTDTVRVSLEVPDAFLKAGGRLSRVEFPPGWQVVIDKEDKPSDVLAHETEQRANRNHGAEHASDSARTTEQQKQQGVLDEMRRKWIKKVTFEGKIPPDGFKDFLLSFQLPTVPGDYRFPAGQLYADGTEISWSELVAGADHPAPTLALTTGKQGFDYQKLAFPASGLALLVSLAALFAQSRKRTVA
jgi:uncharacterized protein YcnI